MTPCHVGLYVIAGLALLGALSARPATAGAAEPVACPTLEGPPPRTIEPGYTIPTIDLAGETQRQTIVDREKGQYLGHPTTVLLEDHRTMLAVYPKGHGGGAVVLKRSGDAGLTWSDRLPTPENWATSQEVPTLYRTVAPDGHRWLIMFSGLYPIKMARSPDDGLTWTPLEPIGDFGGVVAMASCLRLADGSYMALFHDDGRFIHGGSGKHRQSPAGKRTGTWTVYKTLSADGGLTWSGPIAIAKWTNGPHICEPGAIRSPDGKEIALLLRENSRKYNAMVMFSRDEGKTWTPPRQVPAALTGDRHVGRYAPDGRLVISFRDTTRQSPTKGDWVMWVGTYEDIRKERQGQYRVRLMDNHRGGDCAYPAVERLPDGTFIATTYGHWTEGESPYIASVRFTLAEIDAKANAVAGAAGGEATAPDPEKTVVFRSGAEGYHTFRIPSVIATPGGTLLAFAEGRKKGRGDAGNIDLVLKRSTDGGKTWGPLAVVWDDADNTCGNPCPVVDQATGTVWLLLTWNRGDDRESAITDGTSKDTRRVFVTHSTDDGATWPRPTEITADTKKPDWTWYATGPGVGVQLRLGPHKGRLVVPCDHKIKQDRKAYCSHVIVSDDGGKTWRLGGIVQPAVNECQVIERVDGSLLLNMRNYAGKKCRAVATSPDAGETWTSVRYDEALPEPVCQAGLIRYTPSDAKGRSVVLFSNPASAKGRVNMTVRASFDDGATWPHGRTLHAGPAAYSCLVRLPDGRVGCLYEAGEKSPYETITFARFPFEWVTGAAP